MKTLQQTYIVSIVVTDSKLADYGELDRVGPI